MSDRSATFREVAEIRHSSGVNGEVAPGECPPIDDHALLGRYLESRCTESFQSIVTRHKGWIYALAKRHVKDRHLAEDVVQAVFIVLARKAKTIPRTLPLTAWLFRVARFSSNDVVKRESRRRKRIDRVARNLRELADSSIESDVDLDEAIARLSESDQRVILLRFYEDQSMEQIGAVLGITAQAAKKRVSRSIQRLRDTLSRKGHALPAGVILTILLNGTRQSRAAGAFAATSATPSQASVAIARSTLQFLRGARTRLLAALTATSVVLVLGVSTLSPAMGQVLHPVWRHFESLFNWAPQVKPPPTPPPAAAAQSHPPTEIWVGRAGSLAWPIAAPIAGPTPLPMSLHHLPVDKGAVAVIRDKQGAVWYRAIDEELLPPPAVGVEQQSYQQLNPHVSVLYDRIIQEVIDLATFPRSDDTADWQQLPMRDDGMVSPLETNLRFAQDTPAVNQIIVPEPALLPLAAAGIALLQRRRRAMMRACR